MDRATQSGQAAALDDWKQHRARFLVIGLLGHAGPLVNEEVGFYIASLGCERSSATEAFVQEYNLEIARLVSRNGYPDWGILRRRPSRQVCLAALSGAADYRQSLAALPSRTLRATQPVLDAASGTVGPTGWVPRTGVVIEEEVAVVGGDLGARAGIINVFDLREFRWMAKYEFRRRHLPLFPWDAAPG
jgi:hypothetical protein